MMQRADFIELADALRRIKPDFSEFHADRSAYEAAEAMWHQMRYLLVNFCASRNPAFKRQRWLDYVDGVCGPRGGNCVEEPVPIPRHKRLRTI